jgi:hypothetical protein
MRFMRDIPYKRFSLVKLLTIHIAGDWR